MNRFKPLQPPSLAALRCGDAQAWEAFFVCFDPLIRGIAAWPKWRLDTHAQQDVVQIIRAALVPALDNLATESSLVGFVRQVCVHRCIDAVRKRIREQARLQPLGYWDEHGEWEEASVAADASYDPVREVLLAERATRLHAALEQLEPACQSAIRQFYREGRSYQQIAASQGITVSTVGTRLSRCIEKLRKLLQPGDSEPL